MQEKQRKEWDKNMSLNKEASCTLRVESIQFSPCSPHRRRVTRNVGSVKEGVAPGQGNLTWLNIGGKVKGTRQCVHKMKEISAMRFQYKRNKLERSFE